MNSLSKLYSSVADVLATPKTYLGAALVAAVGHRANSPLISRVAAAVSLVGMGLHAYNTYTNQLMLPQPVLSPPHAPPPPDAPRTTMIKPIIQNGYFSDSKMIDGRYTTFLPEVQSTNELLSPLMINPIYRVDSEILSVKMFNGALNIRSGPRFLNFENSILHGNSQQLIVASPSYEVSNSGALLKETYKRAFSHCKPGIISFSPLATRFPATGEWPDNIKMSKFMAYGEAPYYLLGKMSMDCDDPALFPTELGIQIACEAIFAQLTKPVFSESSTDPKEALVSIDLHIPKEFLLSVVNFFNSLEAARKK